MPHPLVNIRHDLPPSLVALQTEHRLMCLEAGRARRKQEASTLLAQYNANMAKSLPETRLFPPISPEEIDRFVDESVRQELTYYKSVRVIQLATAQTQFVLVYGSSADADVRAGSGPFDSLEKAIAWYAKGGR